MRIGKYELYLLNTGSIALDGGAMFGIVPKTLWQKLILPDELNRINMGARCLLLVSEKKKILVDTGIGGEWDEKFRRIYKINQEEFSLLASLKKIGFSSEDITDVILTHLHFDHTGGSTTLVGEKMIPAFPNARYYVQKDHFTWANNPSERDQGSFVYNRFLPLMDEGCLTLLEGENQFDEELELIVINGHTFAQQMLKISDSSNTFLYCADLIPTASHIPLPYVMGYDLQPLVTVKEKQKILSQAYEEDWKILFEHDLDIAYATIDLGEKGFKIREKFQDFQ